MKIKTFVKQSALLLAGVSVLTCANVPVKAENGGWSEETGYYRNAEQYTQAVRGAVGTLATTSAKNSPRHTGKKEYHPNNAIFVRSHGWTTWVGKQHYTRAQLADRFNKKQVVADSQRVWGKNGTEAATPWTNLHHPEMNYHALGFYGDR